MTVLVGELAVLLFILCKLVCIYMPPKASVCLTGNGKPTNKHTVMDNFLLYKRQFYQ